MAEKSEKCYNQVNKRNSRKPKDYSELQFHDDFMFCKILSEYPDICKRFLEVILGRKVSRIVTLEKQKPIEITPEGHGVRFDVYFEGDDSVYDIEMQTYYFPIAELVKRTRYYQGMIDLNSIARGTKYKDLKKSCIIFIMLYDPFNRGKAKYTFRNLCIDDKDKFELGDETEKIFLNAGSDTAEGISPELSSLLKFISGQKPDNELTCQLDALVKKNIDNKDWRLEYMTLNMKLQESRDEGHAEGLAEDDNIKFLSMCNVIATGKERLSDAFPLAQALFGFKTKQELLDRAAMSGFNLSDN